MLKIYLNVQLQWYRSHIGMEVKEARSGDPEPLGHVLGIAKRRGQGHNADIPLQLGGDVAHTRADHLQHRLQGK